MARVVLIGPRPGARGGIAQFTGHLSRELEPHADVHRLSFARLYPGWTGPGRGESTNDPTDAPPSEAGLLAWRPSTWAAAADRIRELRPDTVVMQWWHPAFGPCLRSLARASRAAGARVVFVTHNAVPHERFPFARSLTRRALAEADELVALSEATAGELRSMFPGTPLRVEGHPAYAFPVTAGARAAWRARIGPARPVVCFFGYVRPYKGLADLIAAMPAIRDVHPDAALVVAGPFHEPVERYAEMARSLGIEDAVRLFPGYVPDSLVGGLFDEAHVLVLPYRSGSQSGVLPQALAAGLPVVATSVGGLPEALGGRGFVVPPRDPAWLADGVLRALARGRRAPVVAGWDGWRDAILGAEIRAVAS